MDEADGQWIERHDHPLLNNLILGKVFEHLRGKDLLECRLVCQTWNVSTIPFIRKTLEVTIYGNQSIELHKVENFVETFRSNKLGIPFSRFRLGPFCTTEGAGQEFLQLCGKTIQSIQFPEFPYEEEFFVEDVFGLLRSTLNLEFLNIPYILHSDTKEIVKLFPESFPKPRLTSLKTLNFSSEIPEIRNKFCPTFLKELVTAAENISSLILDDWHCLDMLIYSGVKSSSSVSEVLSVIAKLGRESSIQELEIRYQIKDESEDVEVLRNLRGMNLKRFTYNAYDNKYGQITPDWLFPFLTHSNDTLQYLKLGENVNVSFTTFPKFPRLKELRIKLSEGFSSRFVNLKKICPVLEKLDIWQNHYLPSGIYEFFPESDPCPSMKSFQPLDLHLNINAFNQMLNVFPNLTNLRVHIILDGAEILRQILSRMTQLESLSIYGTMDTYHSLDSVLTGILTPVLAFQEVRDVINKLDKIQLELERRDVISALRNQYCSLRFPSITNLTNLRSLSLAQSGVSRSADYGEDDGTGKLLTDLGGYLGLYSMRSLKHIFVRHCELTKTCCDMLTRDMGLESWSFRTSDDEDIIPYQR